MVASPIASSGMHVEKWPEASWRRLMEAVAEPSRVWATMPRCPSCGRYLAGSDCEPDGRLCWSGVKGHCR